MGQYSEETQKDVINFLRVIGIMDVDVTQWTLIFDRRAGDLRPTHFDMIQVFCEFRERFVMAKLESKPGFTCEACGSHSFGDMASFPYSCECLGCGRIQPHPINTPDDPQMASSIVDLVKAKNSQKVFIKFLVKKIPLPTVGRIVHVFQNKANKASNPFFRDLTHIPGIVIEYQGSIISVVVFGKDGLHREVTTMYNVPHSSKRGLSPYYWEWPPISNETFDEPDVPYEPDTTPVAHA